jgi:hypothetical protein
MLWLVILASCTEQPTGDFDRLKWLAGAWEGTTDSGSHFYETWSVDTKDVMVGRGYAVVQGDTIFGEQLRIEDRADGVFYVAKVAHNVGAVAFELVEITANRAVFTNPDHDFPQRFIYESLGDALHVRGESMDGTRKIDFEFTRVK